MNQTHDRTPGSMPYPLGTRGPERTLRNPHAATATEREATLLSRSEIAHFFRLVREDLKAHDGDWTRPGFQALLVYRFGVWRMTIRSKLWRAPLSVLWRALFAGVRNVYGIELPFSARIGRRVIFEHQNGIVVHGNSVIGDDCVIRQGVTLGIRRLDRLTEAPVLGRAVNVGAGAKILGRVSVGDHAEIGANAVVLDNVPPHTLAVGVPARQVTRRDARVLRGERRARKVAERGLDPATVPASKRSDACQLPESKRAPASDATWPGAT